jgi:hypothetical protein
VRQHKFVISVVYTSSHFATDKKYKDQNVLIIWFCFKVVKIKFTVVIEKSDHGSIKENIFFVLQCQRSGVYKPTKHKLRKSRCSFCSVVIF